MWIDRSSGSPGGLPLSLCGQNPQQAVAAADGKRPGGPQIFFCFFFFF